MAATAPQASSPEPPPFGEEDSAFAATQQARGLHLKVPAERAGPLLLLGLVGAALVMLWLRLLATEPHLPLQLQHGGTGQVVLAASSDPALRPALGLPLLALGLPGGQELATGAALLEASQRWIVRDAARRQQTATRTWIAEALAAPRVVARFEGGLRVELAPQARGLGGLGGMAWALCALALLLWLAGAVTWLAQPTPVSALYAVMAMAQMLGLLLAAGDAAPGLGLPPGWVGLDTLLRQGTDLATAAALVHLTLLFPRPWPLAHRLGLLAWGVAAVLLVALTLGPLPLGWWWLQAAVLAAGVLAMLALRPLPGTQRHPLARQLQRLVAAGVATLALMGLALVLTDAEDAAPPALVRGGIVAWQVFVALLLVLGPALARARQPLREFTLLAGVSTVALSLTLLFTAVLGPHLLVALGLAVLVSLGVYALARPWLMDQLAGPRQLSAERMFDGLYRTARALEQSPGHGMRQLGGLLRELFDPLELQRSPRPVQRVRLSANGAVLVVPVPHPGGGEQGSLVLRHARRGRRLFTPDDRQLCERLIEQLRRAVAYDRAVEHGRAEERARIAQDLHDDIGARLLTLMYKAPNDEIEDYIRHTLQDLKTLTRGLAASNQRLSHAAAEWKADITQRLNAAGCDLHWTFSADRELTLSAVQWSALTRVLRELVNNIITHAQATQVEVLLHLESGHLLLVVSDDGCGTPPAQWAHGLGLGGVRKRVKLLGGQVRWEQRPQGGIRCEMRAELPATPAA